MNLIAAISLITTLSGPTIKPPAPFGAIPSMRQQQWHQREFYGFLHFTVNTFTDKEWGFGDENADIFNPQEFNADKIVKAMKASGMTQIILTAKHHDGFCLWPSATTDHSVKSSSWKNGQGDVVREISESCARHGLKFGVYLSPWDRNNAQYGKPEYIQKYREQLRELLTNYGPISEVWHDGANGGDGFYGGARETRSIDRRKYYDWPTTWEMVRKLQPNATIFSDVGPDIRWVGNESGYANETCWATYSPVGEDGGAPAPGYTRYQEAPTGHRNSPQWLPGECDVSIRPGWFWHEAENGKVKTPRQLMNLYYKSVGRGCSFLLNVPPDRRGILHENDTDSLAKLGEMIRRTFSTNLAKGAIFTASNVRGNAKTFSPGNITDGKLATYWATDDGICTPELIVNLKHEITFDVIRIRENIALGQRIEEIGVDSWENGTWRQIGAATSIGSCRLIKLEQPVTTSKMRLRIVKSPICIAISEFGLYREYQVSYVQKPVSSKR